MKILHEEMNLSLSLSHNFTLYGVEENDNFLNAVDINNGKKVHFTLGNIFELHKGDIQ